MNYVQLGAKGLRVEVDFLFDVSAASAITIHLQTHSGVTKTFAATKVSGEATKAYAVTSKVTSDIDELNTWRVQGKATWADGTELSTQPVIAFIALANLYA